MTKILIRMNNDTKLTDILFIFTCLILEDVWSSANWLWGYFILQRKTQMIFIVCNGSDSLCFFLGGVEMCPNTLWFEWKSNSVTSPASGAYDSSVLSPPVWFYVAEQSCAYPGEEVHLLCVLKKLRWDQVFQRAWGPTRVWNGSKLQRELKSCCCWAPGHGGLCRQSLPCCHVAAVVWLLPCSCCGTAEVL